MAGARLCVCEGAMSAARGSWAAYVAVRRRSGRLGAVPAATVILACGPVSNLLQGLHEPLCLSLFRLSTYGLEECEGVAQRVLNRLIAHCLALMMASARC